MVSILFRRTFLQELSHLDLFQPRQMYRSLVYQCIDKDISSYITLCVASLKDLFSQQLSDMVSINIVRNCQMQIILRRYLIELHTMHDPCLRAIYDNTKQLMNQLDQIFSQCIQSIKQTKPLECSNYTKGWTFQLRKIISINPRIRRKFVFGSIDRVLTERITKEFLLVKFFERSRFIKNLFE